MSESIEVEICVRRVEGSVWKNERMLVSIGLGGLGLGGRGFLAGGLLLLGEVMFEEIVRICSFADVKFDVHDS